MAYLEISHMNKLYNDQMVLKDINLTVSKGEFLAIVGPSGSGKSTLLDIICGFTRANEGTINLENQEISLKSPSQRDVTMVFQDYALFPHMTVAENIEFGLKIRKIKKLKRQEKVQQVARSLELSGYLDKYPKELSGGQKQRVALGRSIVREPKLFLMDEPLSNLDSSLRERTMSELMTLHQELSATIMYVTHSQEEALIMADRIMVLNDGVVHQIATPQDLYQKPADVFVASFIGKPRINIVPVTMENGEVYLDAVSLGKRSYPEFYEKKVILLGVRSESIDLIKIDHKGNWRLKQANYLGGETFYYIEDTNACDREFVVKQQGEPCFTVGEYVEVTINHQESLIFDKDTNKRIGE